MELVLEPIEARILGSLIDKEVTTPDNYPLTLNSLQNACNQKSSREPVMELNQSDIMNAIYELRQKKVVIERMGHDSRVPKYEHILLDMFDFSDEELAIICVLLLRGAQTPGELKTRCNRLYDFDSPSTVEDILEGLITKNNGPYVVKLPRQPGKRECRYCHLLCGEIEISEVPQETTDTVIEYKGNNSKIEELEEKVTFLQTELNELKEQFLAFKKEFE